MKTLSANEAWFSFKGINCRSHLVRMVAPPARPHPARKGRFEDIPGKDGGVWMDEGGYKPIQIAVPCVAEDNINIDSINAWLSGGGALIFGDEPNRAYRARITEEFVRSNLYGVMRGQEFTVSFECEPFRYSANPEADKVGYDPYVDIGIEKPSMIFVNNPGTLISLPLIKITGSGSFSVVVGASPEVWTSGIFLQLKDVDPLIPVYIDCEAKIAYTGMEGYPDALFTGKITGDWPYIPQGESVIRVADAVSAIEVQPRWRWL